MGVQERTEYLGALTRRVWQWVWVEIGADVRAAGFTDLTPVQMSAFRNPGMDGLRPSQLAHELQISKQSVNDLLGQLEARGYITRVPDEADSRSRIITLTTRGRELERVIWQAARDAERKAARIIGADRMRTVLDALRELAQAAR